MTKTKDKARSRQDYDNLAASEISLVSERSSILDKAARSSASATGGVHLDSEDGQSNDPVNRQEMTKTRDKGRTRQDYYSHPTSETSLMHESVSIRGQATRSGATDGGRLNSDDGQSKKNRCCTAWQVVGIVLVLIFGVIVGSVIVLLSRNTGGATAENEKNGMMSKLFGKFSGSAYEDPGTDGKFHINLGMRNDYLLQDCQNGGFKKSFPDLDYALMGYNVLKGYPLAAGHDPGFTQPIFKADYSAGRQSADCKFSIPDGYTIIPDVSCEISFTSETIQNSEDLKKSMGISAEVSGGGWGVSFSASASYKKDSQTFRDSKKVFIISRATCQSYYARMDEVTPPPLDDSFLKWVKRLNNSNEDGDYIEFISYYGTHYMKAVTFGARYLYKHTLTKDSLQQMNSKSMSVETRASYSGLFSIGASFGFSSAQSEAVSEFNEKVETETITVGSAPPKNGDAMEWAAEAKETPVPYRYEMESLEEVFTPALQSQYPDIDMGKIRRNLEYIRLRRPGDIYQKSLGKLCRVYNSAIPLLKTCLLGANDTIETDEKHCIQECLKRDGCIAVTMVNEVLCHFFSKQREIRGIAESSLIEGNDKCHSMLFPFTLKTQVDSYMPSEEPGKLTVIGNTFSGGDDYGQPLSNFWSPCEDICVETPGCVLAAYKKFDFSSPDNKCYLFKGEDVARLKFVFYEGKDEPFEYYLTFIKTCDF